MNLNTENKKNPAISILMSVYNTERFLAEAIQSTLNQTFSDFEFIIINDASTDRSLEIIKSFHDPRIRIINNEANIGITKSLNKGIDIASGEYIARIDADDVNLPERLEIQYDFLKKNPDIALVGAWAEIINEEGKIIRTKKTSIGYEKIKFSMIFENPFIHSSILFKKNKIGKYDESFLCAQDYELYARVVLENKIDNIPQALIRYRSHEQSIGRTTNTKIIQEENRRKIAHRYVSHFIDIKKEDVGNMLDCLRNPQEKKLADFFKALKLDRAIFIKYKEKLENKKEVALIKEIYRDKRKMLIKNMIKKLITK